MATTSIATKLLHGMSNYGWLAPDTDATNIKNLLATLRNRTQTLYVKTYVSTYLNMIAIIKILYNKHNKTN